MPPTSLSDPFRCCSQPYHYYIEGLFSPLRQTLRHYRFLSNSYMDYFPCFDFDRYGHRLLCKSKNKAGLRLWLLQSDHRRSEEHTSELQSREKLVCRLLLEKKKLH